MSEPEPPVDSDAPPVPLAYGRPGGPGGPRRLGAAVEAGLGFLTYAGYLAALFGAWTAGAGSAMPVVAVVGLCGVASLAVYLRRQRGWRGFVPGLAIGLLVSCLLLGGGVWYVISTCKPV